MEIPGVNKKEVEFPEGWPINSINVFQGKIQTVQFTNIYEHILFLRDIHMIPMIMKTN